MDIVVEVEPLPNPPTLPTTVPESPSNHANERRRDLLLDALKAALADGREHRLFRSGRLDGLFPSKLGESGEAARQALAANLIEHVRTESRGKFIFEWVRATPNAMEFVRENDSPKAILRELRTLLGEANGEIPSWLQQATAELRALNDLVERRSADLIARLTSIAERVEAALRRSESNHPQGTRGATTHPWTNAALDYLDRRREAQLGPCPLSELFQAVSTQFPSMTIPEFHEGLRRLNDVRSIVLEPGDGNWTDPEFAILANGKLNRLASR